MKKYILTLDLGTTSIRAFLINKKGEIHTQLSKEFCQYFPNSGWVEHDANEIWLTLLSIISTLFIEYNVNIDEIDSIGITNQRETTLLWNKETGLPVYNAIVWQSRQTSSICDNLIENGFSDLFKNKTGLPIDAYFSGTKVKWIIDNVKGVDDLINKDKILFGTIDTWIIWKLSGGHRHVTDYTNASRTMLYNIYNLEWDDELLDILSIPKKILPEVLQSSQLFTTTDEKIFFGHKIPIYGVCGDQHAALFGHGCFNNGDVKNTYGTGCFMLMNTKYMPVKSNLGLLTTIAWGINNKVEYALEGSVFVGGSAVGWLKDGLEIINDVSESEKYASKVNSTNGVYFVPAFVGLATPYWDSDVRGSFFGLTRSTTKEEFIRAVLESICFRTKDVLETMTKVSGIDLNKLTVDGGASKNSMLMQFQSDILGIDVDVCKNNETTALGIAFLAGLASGFFKSQEEISNLIKIGKKYKNTYTNEKRVELYDGWKRAIKAAIAFKK
ncbi:MAG: glycerol kinase GlpK [Bacilli bacterium]